MTEQEKIQLSMELESIGVKDALILIEQRLADTKFQAKVATFDFTTATQAEIKALYEEANAAGGRGWTKQASEEYIAQRKIIEAPIDTTNLFEYESTVNSISIDWDKMINPDGAKKATDEAKKAIDEAKQAMSQAKSDIQNLQSMTIAMLRKGYEQQKKIIQDQMKELQDKANLDKKIATM